MSKLKKTERRRVDIYTQQRTREQAGGSWNKAALRALAWKKEKTAVVRRIPHEHLLLIPTMAAFDSRCTQRAAPPQSSDSIRKPGVAHMHCNPSCGANQKKHCQAKWAKIFILSSYCENFLVLLLREIPRKYNKYKWGAILCPIWQWTKQGFRLLWNETKHLQMTPLTGNLFICKRTI